MRISEKAIRNFWLNFSRDIHLSTTDGRAVKVIYPGYENAEPGPDFVDSVLNIDDEIVKGDIECHVKTSLWYEHSHDKNPDYNLVVLHTVWVEDEKKVFTQSGSKIPTVELKAVSHLFWKKLVELKQVEKRAMELKVYPFPCVDRVNPEAVFDQIARCFEIRFERKVNRFKMRADDSEQMIYTGIAEALGYSKNKEPMVALAQACPFHEMKKMPLNKIVNALIRASTSIGGWRSEGIRPSNLPKRRILALAHLINKYKDGFNIMDVWKRGASFREWEDIFFIKDLVGRGRSRAIVINIAMPCLVVLGANSAEVKSFLWAYPPEVPNIFMKRMNEGLFRYVRISKADMNNAAFWQGAMELFLTRCKRFLCSDCPIFK